MQRIIAFCAATILIFLCLCDSMAEEPLSRFTFHGIAAPVSYSRGVVATVDENGHNIILAWLFDHRGGYGLTMINADTSTSVNFNIPFPPEGDGPFASILSSRNRFYTVFNGYFLEFNVFKKEFTFCGKIRTKTAMSMTEDDQGIIWAATYRKGGVVSYNPETSELKDYGALYEQEWAVYPRSIAADDEGWIYFALGFKASQIIAFNPLKMETVEIIPDGDRRRGMACVYRGVNGKVYGKAIENSEARWLELYKGECAPTSPNRIADRKRFIAGTQGLFHRTFPSGLVISEFDTIKRRFVIEDPIKKIVKKEMNFDYPTEGANIVSLCAFSNGMIFGGTMFPMRAFCYNPKANYWLNRESYGQWNTVITQKKLAYIGGYTRGVLLEWDPSKPWVATDRENSKSNPRFLYQGSPAINRPTKILSHDNGRKIVLAGTPKYGLTGGGLLLWDREKRTAQLLEDKDLIPNHSTISLVSLPGGRLFGGTTTAPGTGGERLASEAQLYLMDTFSKQIIWKRAALPGVREYTDLCLGPRGLIYGIADRVIFFVFDIKHLKVVKAQQMDPSFGGTTKQQGRRVLIRGDSMQEIFVLFTKGLAQIDTVKNSLSWLIDSPVPITAGGAYLDGRIYFGSGSKVYSYKVERSVF